MLAAAVEELVSIRPDALVEQVDHHRVLAFVSVLHRMIFVDLTQSYKDLFGVLVLFLTTVARSEIKALLRCHN